LRTRTPARIAGVVLIVAAFVATIGINYFTISHIWRARTRVPWADEWAMIQEFILYKRGSPLLPLLWSSYWGHRLVIPRLVLFANLQWASWQSLTWLTFALQSIHIALLCVLSWALVGRRSRWLFAVSVVAILNLMFSPAQMENFVWSIQFMFPLVHVAASLAFLCLALNQDRGHRSFLLLCLVSATVASLTMPSGLLVWPVLVAQASYLKMKRRATTAIALLGAGIIGSYCWHYQSSSPGMGLIGMLRHPVDAIGLVALLLGGALNTISLRLGIATVLLALAGAVYSGAKVLGDRPGGQSYLSALVAIIVFNILSAASIVAGRLTPEWLAGDLVVPSRYFTLIEAFWASLAILLLYFFCHKRRSLVLAGFYGPLYVCLMFFPSHVQKSSVEDWSDFFRGADAVGAALISDAPDDKLLSVLWPVQPQRDNIVAFLRQGHLSVFAEPRAEWQGRPISKLFQRLPADRCIGGIEREFESSGSAGRVVCRLEGWAWDTSANRGFDYLLITEAAGLIVGTARGGFRHRYFPGFFTDIPVSPVSHMRFPASEWLGYVRQPVKTPWTIYGISPHTDRICKIEDEGN
jgi:hypothetical protein